MIRQEFKRRNVIDHKKQQFAAPAYGPQEYPYRLNLYERPPTAEITLEQFEQWAIDRLRSNHLMRQSLWISVLSLWGWWCPVLAEIETCSFRNKSAPETVAHVTPLLQQWLPLSSNSSSSAGYKDEKLRLERQKDHYSHYILRLAFSSTEDLRRRFSRLESALFKIRFQSDDRKERQSFVGTLNLNWEVVPEEEKRELGSDILNGTSGLRRQELEEGGLFKVDFETVPELIEHRKVFVKSGKAYVPGREQLSIVLTEFCEKLDNGLEVCKPPFANSSISSSSVYLYDLGHRSGTSPPRRRRPTYAYIKPSFEKFRHAWLWNIWFGNSSSRRVYQRRFCWLTIPPFSYVHAESAYHAT